MVDISQIEETHLGNAWASTFSAVAARDAGNLQDNQWGGELYDMTFEGVREKYVLAQMGWIFDGQNVDPSMHGQDEALVGNRLMALRAELIERFSLTQDDIEVMIDEAGRRVEAAQENGQGGVFRGWLPEPAA